MVKIINNIITLHTYKYVLKYILYIAVDHLTSPFRIFVRFEHFIPRGYRQVVEIIILWFQAK